MRDHFQPVAHFYNFAYLREILQDSKIAELFVPLLPLLWIGYKSLGRWFKCYWPFILYSAVVMIQPFLAYHLTGNNFQRLALQGAWVFFFIAGLESARYFNQPFLRYGFVLYSLCIYFTWGMTQRYIFVATFSAIWLFILLKEKLEKRSFLLFPSLKKEQ